MKYFAVILLWLIVPLSVQANKSLEGKWVASKIIGTKIYVAEGCYVGRRELTFDLKTKSFSDNENDFVEYKWTTLTQEATPGSVKVTLDLGTKKRDFLLSQAKLGESLESILTDPLTKTQFSKSTADLPILLDRLCEDERGYPQQNLEGAEIKILGLDRTKRKVAFRVSGTTRMTAEGRKKMANCPQFSGLKGSPPYLTIEVWDLETSKQEERLDIVFPVEDKKACTDANLRKYRWEKAEGELKNLGFNNFSEVFSSDQEKGPFGYRRAIDENIETSAVTMIDQTTFTRTFFDKATVKAEGTYSSRPELLGWIEAQNSLYAAELAPLDGKSNPWTIVITKLK